MKLCIAGSRHIDKRIAFWEALQHLEPVGDFSLVISFKGKEVTEFVTGDCPTGPDQVPDMLRTWWEIGGYGLNADITRFSPDWKQHGRAAGPIRNRKMAEYIDGVLLIWDGKSRGSANMKKEMEALGKPIFEVIVRS